MVCLVFAFGMDNTKNLKVKDLKVIICYYLGSENLKGIPIKLGLVEAVTELFRIFFQILFQREGGDRYVVINEYFHEAIT